MSIDLQIQCLVAIITNAIHKLALRVCERIILNTKFSWDIGGVMIIIIETRNSNTSSNPRQDFLHIISYTNIL